MSSSYIFSELEKMKNNDLINANTYILKDGEEEAKIAGALFDFNFQNTLPNTDTISHIDSYQYGDNKRS